MTALSNLLLFKVVDPAILEIYTKETSSSYLLSPLDGLKGGGRIVENDSALFDVGIETEQALASPKKDVKSPLTTMTIILIVFSIFIVSALFRN